MYLTTAVDEVDNLVLAVEAERSRVYARVENRYADPSPIVLWELLDEGGCLDLFFGEETTGWEGRGRDDDLAAGHCVTFCGGGGDEAGRGWW